jgi:vacuolar-type H+-ATPase subunit I/STV1
MRIALAMGFFFLALGIIFGFAAGSDYRAQKRWTPAGIARRRIAVIFTIVGLALIIWQTTL